MDIQNQLRMARESEKSPQDQAIDAVKKKVKRKVLFWFCTTVLPWLLLILAIAALIIAIWYMGCSNSSSTFSGWVISKLMHYKGMCPK